MNIFENKRVLLLSALFSLAFAGLAYYGYGRIQDFTAAQDQLREINDQFLDYESAEFPPTVANRDAVRKAADIVTQQVKDLNDTLSKYADACRGNDRVISPPEFQNQVLRTIKDVSRQAADKGCNIASPAADLGMGQYKGVAPREAQVPYLHFQLRAVRRLAEAVIDSGSPSLEKVYCAQLPEDLSSSEKKADYLPLNMEIAFNAKRSTTTDGQTADKMSVLPQVLNKLTTDSDFFFLITGVSVAATNQNLQQVDTWVAPEKAAPVGEDLTSDSDAKPEVQVAAAREIAKRKTGNPDETARVHLTVQVLYFNPNPTKAKQH